MKTKFNFMNVAGNAFRDITETVLTMEYNTEFNHARVASTSLAGMRHPLDDADDSSAEIGCHLWKYWSISVRIARGEIDTQLAVRRRFSRPIKVALSGHIGHLRPKCSGGRYVSQPHIYCTGPHSLWLGGIRLYMFTVAPMKGALGYFLCAQLFIYCTSRGPTCKFFIYINRKQGCRVAGVFWSGPG